MCWASTMDGAFIIKLDEQAKHTRPWAHAARLCIVSWDGVVERGRVKPPTSLVIYLLYIM